MSLVSWPNPSATTVNADAGRVSKPPEPAGQETQAQRIVSSRRVTPFGKCGQLGSVLLLHVTPFGIERQIQEDIGVVDILFVWGGRHGTSVGCDLADLKGRPPMEIARWSPSLSGHFR